LPEKPLGAGEAGGAGGAGGAGAGGAGGGEEQGEESYSTTHYS